MIRIVAWLQILLVLGCVGYSTYYMFQGDFEKALLPYPILILYYLIFMRKRPEQAPSQQENGSEG
jgi:hypothetical protein